MAKRAATILFFCSLAGAAAGAEAPRDPARAFVVDLQAAVRRGDAGWVARHGAYPMRWNAARTRTIRSAAAFRAGWRRIVTPGLAAAILDQNPDDVFRNWQGIMIGSGTHNVWVRTDDTEPGAPWRIVTVNDEPPARPRRGAR